jgi:hypothetical protein
MNLKSAEFVFIPPNAEGESVTYSVVVAHGLSVVFVRMGSKLRPFGVIVPRLAEERYTEIDAETLARCAIGLALRDGLFNKHPDEPVYLDADGPQWQGQLDHGTYLPATVGGTVGLAPFRPAPVVPITGKRLQRSAPRADDSSEVHAQDVASRGTV